MKNISPYLCTNDKDFCKVVIKKMILKTKYRGKHLLFLPINK